MTTVQAFPLAGVRPPAIGAQSISIIIAYYQLYFIRLLRHVKAVVLLWARDLSMIIALVWLALLEALQSARMLLLLWLDVLAGK